MSTTIERRLALLETRHTSGGQCWCVWYEPRESEPEPPALCPHGRPWAIKVVYDETPVAIDGGDPPAGGEGQHGHVG